MSKFFAFLAFTRSCFSLSFFLASTLFYWFSLSVFNLQCFLMGACQTESCQWSATGGAGWAEGSAPWCGAFCLPKVGWSQWQRSLRPWTVISLSVVGPPKEASSTPQVSLPSHVSFSEHVDIRFLYSFHSCMCM